MGSSTAYGQPDNPTRWSRRVGGDNTIPWGNSARWQPGRKPRRHSCNRGKHVRRKQLDGSKWGEQYGEGVQAVSYHSVEVRRFRRREGHGRHACAANRSSGTTGSCGGTVGGRGETRADLDQPRSQPARWCRKFWPTDLVWTWRRKPATTWNGRGSGNKHNMEDTRHPTQAEEAALNVGDTQIGVPWRMAEWIEAGNGGKGLTRLRPRLPVHGRGGRHRPRCF